MKTVKIVNREKKLELLKRKRRRWRNFKRFLFVLLMLLIIAASFTTFSYYKCEYRDYTVSGSNFYNKDTFKNYAGANAYYDNAMLLFLATKLVPLEGIPFVDEVDIKLTSLNTVEYVLTDKDFFGVHVTESGQSIYYDDECKVVEISDRYVAGCMDISGIIDDKKITVDGYLGVSDNMRKYIIKLIDMLEAENVKCDGVEVLDYGGIIVKIGDVKVNFGTNTLLEDKVKRYIAISPNLEGLAGTLHLENYETGTKDIIFNKDE